MGLSRRKKVKRIKPPSQLLAEKNAAATRKQRTARVAIDKLRKTKPPGKVLKRLAGKTPSQVLAEKNAAANRRNK